MDEERTAHFLRKLDREEKRKRKMEGEGQDEGRGDEMAAGCVVPDEPELIAESWNEEDQVEGDGLDPKMVKDGRKDEVMVQKLDMFEFGTRQEAMARSG